MLKNQRETKFRAWDKTNKRWVNFTAIEFKRGKVFLKDGFGNYIDGDFEVVEFTGLKDKNNKEIYGGDIILNKENVISRRNRVINYQKGSFMLDNSNSLKSFYDGKNIKDEIEVIGNIYENPKLLK